MNSEILHGYNIQNINCFYKLIIPVVNYFSQIKCTCSFSYSLCIYNTEFDILKEKFIVHFIFLIKLQGSSQIMVLRLKTRLVYRFFTRFN